MRDHREFLDGILRELSPRFEEMYSAMGRPSIPPEQLLRALVIQLLYSIRSERQLMEQLNYYLLFRWFVGLGIDDPVWVPTTFSKDRDRLLEADIAKGFLATVVGEAERRDLVSDDHFTVDGTLMETWASQKSFRPKGEPADDDSEGGRNPSVDFRKEKRSNETHESTTDPDPRLAKKATGQAAKLSYQGNVLMENRNGLIVDAEVAIVTGTSEVEAAVTMMERMPPRERRRTVGADKLYDQGAFVDGARAHNFTTHVAQNTTNRRSAIDGRTTRHPGYAVSQRKRKLVEQGFGWKKTTALLRKLRHRGRDKDVYVHSRRVQHGSHTHA